MLQFVAYMLKSYLTLKLTFWAKGSSEITKILPEKNFSGKITWNSGITLVSSIICYKSYFRLPDFEIDAMTKKMSFYHQNSKSNGLFSQNDIKTTYYTFSAICVFFKSYFHIFALGIDFFVTLSWNWLCTWPSKSNEKAVVIFVKSYILSYLTLKLTFWPWRWPWIIKIVSEMDCPVKITWKWGITLVPSFILLKNHIWPWDWPLTLNLQKCSNFSSWHSSDLHSAEKNR